MTDRIHSLTVVLNNDLREDDIELMISAIKQFRHVQDVACNVADHSHYIALTRIRFELIDKLYGVLNPK